MEAKHHLNDHEVGGQKLVKRIMPERSHPRIDIATHATVDHVHETLHLHEQAVLREDYEFLDIDLEVFFMLMVFILINKILVWSFWVTELFIYSILDFLLLLFLDLKRIVFVLDGIIEDTVVHVLWENAKDLIDSELLFGSEDVERFQSFVDATTISNLSHELLIFFRSYRFFYFVL